MEKLLKDFGVFVTKVKEYGNFKTLIYINIFQFIFIIYLFSFNYLDIVTKKS